MGFSINTQAILANVNPRKENHGEEPVTALDLKFDCEDVDASVCFPILGIHGSEAAQQAFYDLLWDGDGPRFSGIDSIECWAKFEEGHHLSGGLSTEKVETDKVHKFSFKPRGSRRVDLSFTVAVTDPDDHFIERAIHMMKDRVKLVISHSPELDLAEPETT